MDHAERKAKRKLRNLWIPCPCCERCRWHARTVRGDSEYLRCRKCQHVQAYRLKEWER